MPESVEKSNLIKMVLDETVSWQEFKGLNNSNEVLIKKAGAIATLVYMLAGQNTSLILKYYENETKSKTEVNPAELTFEILFFSIHFIDRIVYLKLGKEKRDYFIDILLVIVKRLIGSDAKIKDNEVDDLFDFTKTFYQRQKEYGKFKQMIGEEGVGTLFYEFGPRIVQGLATGSFGEKAFSISWMHLPINTVAVVNIFMYINTLIYQSLVDKLRLFELFEL